MAPAKKCPECKYVMYAQDEKYDDHGMLVTYVCQNRTCESHKRGYPYKVKEYVGDRR